MLKNISFQPSRIEKSTPTSIISASYYVYHMELDLYKPGNIVYTDKHALMTYDGTTTHLIAGNSTQYGYREGVGADARFDLITGFAQISEKLVVVADIYNHCMRLIDRTTNNTSAFSGQCKSFGYKGGRPGQFFFPRSVVMDKRDKNQLLITDSWNKSVRTVGVESQAVGTFKQSASLNNIIGITQEEKSGDLYVTAEHALYKITYIQKTLSLISGSMSTGGYKDSTLRKSLFNYLGALIFITPETLLVADNNNKKLRLLELKPDRVTTLNVTNSLNYPRTLLLTNNSLYVGQYKKITQYKCEYSFTTNHLKQ